MRLTLVRLIFCFTAVTVGGVVRGDPITLEADYFVSVSGTNADGSNIFISRETSPTGIQDPSSIKFGDSFKGSTDDGDGFATVDFAGFATHQDKKKLLGARISGSASFLRIPFVSAGGVIGAAGEIRLAYHDFITLQVPGPNPSEPTRIEGFLKLHGSMDASSSKTGSSTGGRPQQP